MLAHSAGRKRLHELYLVRAIQAWNPASVVGVGFGYGLNLLLLSMQLPDVHFAGVELTEAGCRTALTLARDPETVRTLKDFAVGPILDPLAPARLDLRVGSAAALPLPDKSMDMVITVLALEQMERIRAQALRELARVARRHVIMIEPFYDWNAAGHRRKYIERYDYFDARIEDLPEYGLTPIVATADMPNKLAFRAGVVVTAVHA
jgi:hypothetical protein